MTPEETIRGERCEIIRGKHYEVVVEFDEEYVIIAVAPIWDSARRRTLDIVLHRDRLREELDERLRDLLHVLAKARKAVEGKLGSTAFDRNRSSSIYFDQPQLNSIDTDKSQSISIDRDGEG